MKNIIYIIITFGLMINYQQASGQDEAYIIDRVVAVVGDFHVLQSDIEQQYLQLKMSQPYIPEGIKCDILNYLIEQKLLMTQAKIDSIEVSASQVELSMEARLNNFVSQFGSEEEMEAYFNKSIYDIRDDLRKTMREMMITQQVQQSIVGDLKITPSEVKHYYSQIEKDSIPYIDSEVKIAEIVAYPPLEDDAVFDVRERLLELRKRIIEGESMSTLAILYSDDPSATSNFGEIGFRNKNELDPAYADAAWALKEGQLSKIVESSFGFHIIQCVERRGERVNTRHILLKPKISATAKGKALEKLDSIRTRILEDSLTFQIAAIVHSEDEDTRANGGLVVNPMDQAPTFKFDELETKDYYTVREMKVGDISLPYETTDDNGQLCYKILKLISKTEPHRANLKQDYLLLQNMALSKKQNDAMNSWYAQKKKRTYIRIDNSFEDCDMLNNELTEIQ
ncbi:MAG: peptidylprolyl isomerase [Bacteroidales bacterium]|nr:peptidylprolyl isomerase [Bacteroidales bacterium]